MPPTIFKGASRCGSPPISHKATRGLEVLNQFPRVELKRSNFTHPPYNHAKPMHSMLDQCRRSGTPSDYQENVKLAASQFCSNNPAFYRDQLHAFEDCGSLDADAQCYQYARCMARLQGANNLDATGGK